MAIAMLSCGGTGAHAQDLAALATMEAQVKGIVSRIEEGVTVTLHVNPAHPEAADTNAGSKDLPFKTFARGAAVALENKAQNIGTRVLLYPGTYRESVELALSPSNNAPLVIEARDLGQTFISGSEVWSDGWAKGERPGEFVHAWPYDWGLYMPESWKPFVVMPPITQRREIVFVNGRMLRQVLSRDELAEDTFHVSESDDTLRIRLAPQTELAACRFEVGTRESALKIQNGRNLVIRGLVFQHCASRVTANAAQALNCANVLIESCTAQDNNDGGLVIGGLQMSNVVMRSCQALRNGGMGMSSWIGRHQIFENNTYCYNNWRGDMGNFRGWGPTGMKNFHWRGAIVRNNVAIGNFASGFWLDTGCADTLIEDSLFAHNVAGVFFEANHGPITLRRCRLAFNDIGLTCAHSRNLTIEDCVFYGNRRKQIQVVASGAPRQMDDAYAPDQFIPLVEENYVLRRCAIVATQPGQMLMDVGGTEFFKTFTSERNLWYSPDGKGSFDIAKLPLDFARWQQAGNVDLDSGFAAPGFTNPDAFDFTFSAQSPLRQRGTWPTRSFTASEPRGQALLAKMKLAQIRESWERPWPLAQQAAANAWLPLDLDAFVNRPLTGMPDCWIGLQELEYFTTGARTIQGVPFRITTPREKDGNVAVALRSLKAPSTRGKALPGEVVIPVNQPARAIYFLNACGWVNEPGKIGEYALVYDDGSRVKMDVVPFELGSEHLHVREKQMEEATIQDWYPVYPQFDNAHARHVVVHDPADPNRYSRFIYVTQWVNPQPEKTIRSIVLRSETERQPVLLVLGLTVLKP